MKKIIQIKCKKELIEILKKKIFINYNELISDYSKKFEKKTIKKSFLKQRLFARLLAYRSIQPETILPIVNFLEKKYKKKLYLAPFFYIRYCYPNEYFIKGHKDSALYTEPHYDKYTFNNKGLSFWIPLHKTTKQSGTLCYIKKNSEIAKEFPQEGKNRYNIINYLKEFKEVDKKIKKNIKNVYCDFGNILSFDQNVLHGASRPIKKVRISLNFQISFSKKIYTDKKFYYSNKFLKEKNLINSLKFGDYIFYENNKFFFDELFKKKATPTLLKDNFKKLLKNKKKIKSNALLKDVHYSKEDNWLN